MARKKPTCGFELEYAIDYNLPRHRSKLKRRAPEGWEIIRESAVGHDFCGIEVVSPIIKNWKKSKKELATILEDMKEIKKASKNRRKVGPISPATAQHVHVGIKGYTLRELQRLICNFIKAEKYFFLHTPRRRKSSWCTPILKSDSATYLLCKCHPKYKGRNWWVIDDKPTQEEALRLIKRAKMSVLEDTFEDKGCAIRISEFGTIEFRMALSSESTKEVFDWAQTCRNFVHEFTRRDFRTRTQFLDLIPEGKLKRRIHAAMGL